VIPAEIDTIIGSRIAEFLLFDPDLILLLEQVDSAVVIDSRWVVGTTDKNLMLMDFHTHTE